MKSWFLEAFRAFSEQGMAFLDFSCKELSGFFSALRIEGHIRAFFCGKNSAINHPFRNGLYEYHL